MIHPTAIVHPEARIGPGTKIGPYAVIDEPVEIGSENMIGPHVYITGRTKIGNGNRFHAGCVIGNAPQDLKYKGEPTELVIGDNNSIREAVTVNRSSTIGDPTVIGSNNLLMACSHIAHNTQVGNHVIIANGALLGGHVIVGDRAVISGTCMVHQFVRIGTLAMMQGGSGVSKDLPPYTMARGNNQIAGLNITGLRRAGFSAEDRLKLKRLYHLLFRGPGRLKDRIAAAEASPLSAVEMVLLKFVQSGARGFCADRSRTSEEGADED